MDHEALVELRRTRLKQLTESFPSLQAFANAVERDHAYVWQLVHGRRPIGEKIAAHIESALSLPKGYLSDEAPVGTVVAEAVKALPPDIQRESLNHLLYLIQRASSVAASPRFGSYTKMIQGIMADMDKKNGSGDPSEPSVPNP